MTRRVAGMLAAALLALGYGVVTAPNVAAQEENSPEEAPSRESADALRVFFDCQGGRNRGSVCDYDFYRREISYVNYTRDREDAQLHILLTVANTGSGGQRVIIDFIGRGEFADIDDRLEAVTRANLADEQRLSHVAQILELGLARYIARTDQATDLEIRYDAESREQSVATPEDDPWNFWTLRIGGNVNLNVDQRTERYELGGDFTANRITDALKLEFEVEGEYDRRVFDTTDTTSVTSIRKSYSADGLAVWSLSRHWSLGARASFSHSSFDNRDLGLRLGPAIEFNIFPYSESTRRHFSFLYTVGVGFNDYVEETVFLQEKETLPHHRVSTRLSVRQPWGQSYGSLTFFQYLHDPSKNRFSAHAGADFRVFRGLSLRINGEYSRIRDQLNVPAGDASAEDVLLRQRILQSGFRYRLSVGFSYTFGSIFSNVVNPRLNSF